MNSLKKKKPNISYFKVVGCSFTLINDKDKLKKFDAKSDEEIFLGYSSIIEHIEYLIKKYC